MNSLLSYHNHSQSIIEVRSHTQILSKGLKTGLCCICTLIIAAMLSLSGVLSHASPGKSLMSAAMPHSNDPLEMSDKNDIPAVTLIRNGCNCACTQIGAPAMSWCLPGMQQQTSCQSSIRNQMVASDMARIPAMELQVRLKLIKLRTALGHQ